MFTKLFSTLKNFSFFLLTFTLFFASCNKSMDNESKKITGDEKYNYLISDQLSGWNTYNTRSTLSFVNFPSCFSINIGFKDYTNKEVLTETIPGFDHEDLFLGAHAYDGSYTCQELKWSGMRFRIESAHERDDLVILVTPIEVDKVKVPDYFIALQHSPRKKHPEFVKRIKPPVVIIETGMLWNKPGFIEKKENSIHVKLEGENISVFTVGKAINEYYVGSIKTPYITLNGFNEVGVSTSKQRTLEEIKDIIEIQKGKHEKIKSSYGSNKDVFDAIQTCIAWNMMYDPQDDRLLTPVSRRWNYNNKGYVIYCWDTYFGAYQAAATGNKAVAYSNVIEMTREKTKDGFVPNVRKSNGAKTRDRSQPPVGSFCTREIYNIFGDKWFLELVYDDLKEWNEWWSKKRDYNGLLCYGSNYYDPVNGYPWEHTFAGQVHDWFGASMESGWDGSIIYEDQDFDKERSILKLWDVSLNGLYIQDCRALADIADVLGKKQDADKLRQRANKYATEMMDKLWDEKSGFFKNKNWETGDFPDFTAINGFLALLSGKLNEKQLESVINNHLLDPKEFKTPFIIPTVPKSNPVYSEDRYWDGRVWPPVNFLVYLGLKQYDRPITEQAVNYLVRNSKELLLQDWHKYHFVRENYDPVTGTGKEENYSASFYHWGGLLGMMTLIEEGVIPNPVNK